MRFKLLPIKSNLTNNIQKKKTWELNHTQAINVMVTIIYLDYYFFSVPLLSMVPEMPFFFDKKKEIFF